MKKFLAIILSIVTCFAFVACSSSTDSGSSSGSGSSSVTKTQTTYKIGVVDGAPSLSVVNIANGFEYETADTKYTANIKVIPADGAPTKIASEMNKTDGFDMAIAPLNVAYKLHNSNAKFKLASVNVFGVLYMIGKTSINEDMNNLKGKIVCLTSGGGTPEILFKHLLAKNQIEFEESDTVTDANKVYIKYVGAQQIIAGLKQGTVEYGVLGEPAVTKANAATGSIVVLDLQKEWKKFYGEGQFVQAGLIVNSEKVNVEFVNALVEKLKQNKQYLYDNADGIGNTLVSVYSETVMKGIKFNASVLDRCNIGCETAKSQKSAINAFLTAHGLTAPNDDFYFI